MSTAQRKVNILAIIPARGGSKGVLKKNIRTLNGKPLIAWSIEEAKKSNLIHRIVVTTDDDEIAAVSKNFGAEVIKRPPELAKDDSPTCDAIIHLLDVLHAEKYIPDYIIQLQPTSPMRRVQHIDDVIRIQLERGPVSVASVTPLEHPPYWNRCIDENGCLSAFISYDKEKFKRRQDFKTVYRLNGAVHIISTKIFREIKGFETEGTYAYVMDALSSVDIDNETDLEYAEFLMKKYSDVYSGA